ncbi:MAG: 1,4-alpha-glucan branching protein GlgB [Phycisphaeraceae bacterium]|nr:1,4-alpha-glucan branching protein GlgB [Phycisphaeraceae bacterium]
MTNHLMMIPSNAQPSFGQPVQESGWISADDQYWFNEGTHAGLYEKLGAHPLSGGRGVRFGVWAPNARAVSVVGDWNHWTPGADMLSPIGSSGIWMGVSPHAREGCHYKYLIDSHAGGRRLEKTDPFGFRHEQPPRTASIVHGLAYHWNDAEWMRTRGERHRVDRPMSIYELHLGSWRRVLEDGYRSLNYRELAPVLAEYCNRLGFTHVELMPVMEHPLYKSWGYQTTGYFAPTSRYGTPQDFMFLIDTLHQAGIGVILDWVPSHFPGDGHGLALFDGTHLFEHADPREGFHPDWKSMIFNYGRHEVRSFLISSAMFWLDKYHVDGIRVDAVASMLYRDYSRKEGEWVPNRYGGRENLEAIGFLRQLNTTLYGAFPDIVTFAEESTAWPGVSRPAHLGGLGFGYKWDMGWMHDTLHYLGREPIHRKYHHNEISFRAVYQFSENYVLPLSHDEVVHGKGSLLGRMPGDEWQRMANMRLLYGLQWTQPGKKLLFMGGELAQVPEWNHDSSVEWHLEDVPHHASIAALVGTLNDLYKREPALHERDCDPRGFEWVDCTDAETTVIAYLRRGVRERDTLLVVANFTPVVREGYRLGVPFPGFWEEALNTDAACFGGSDVGNKGGVTADEKPFHGRPYSLCLTLPPLSVLVLRCERGA